MLMLGWEAEVDRMVAVAGMDTVGGLEGPADEIVADLEASTVGEIAAQVVVGIVGLHCRSEELEDTER